MLKWYKALIGTPVFLVLISIHHQSVTANDTSLSWFRQTPFRAYRDTRGLTQRRAPPFPPTWDPIARQHQFPFRRPPNNFPGSGPRPFSIPPHNFHSQRPRGPPVHIDQRHRFSKSLSNGHRTGPEQRPRHPPPPPPPNDLRSTGRPAVDSHPAKIGEQASENTKFRSEDGPGGCNTNEGFRFAGEIWYAHGCRRRKCINFKGSFFTETDSCDTEFYNTTYKCIIQVDTQADYPDCCPKYKCNPDNLGLSKEQNSF